MAAGDIINGTVDLVDVVLELGAIGRWVQALGLIVILWIIIQIINLLYNRKRRKFMEKVEKDIKRIEKKIDVLGKKRK